MKQRDVVIDIMKGLAILIIVLWHADSPFGQYLKPFHVGVFFMISGYLVNDYFTQNIKGIGQLSVKRLKSLIIPFIFFNAVCLFLNNMFIKLHIYISPVELNGLSKADHTVKNMYSLKSIFSRSLNVVFNGGAGGLAGATWVLKALFFIVMISAALHFIVSNIADKNKRNIIIIVMAFIFLLAGFYLSQKNCMLMIGIVCTNLILYEIGYMICVYKKNNEILAGNIWTRIIIVLICIAVVFVSRHYGNISYANNEYHNPLILILSACAGWVLILNLAMIIRKNASITKVMSYVGRNTLPILCMHFFAFKFVTLFQIWFYKDSVLELSSFPVFRSGGIWWIVYAAVGIVIPLGINVLYQKCKYCFVNLVKEKGINSDE